MKVLHLVKGLGPGGAERLLVSLTRAWGEEPQAEVGYVLPGKDHLVGELETGGVVTHLLAGHRGLGDPRWPVRLRTLVRDRRYDVVHLHSPAMASVARPVLRTVRPRPKIVSTEHNQWQSYSLMTRFANALTLPLDDERLAVSDEVKASMWRPWRRRAVVLVHGVPVEALARRRLERVDARAELGLGPADVAVVTIANFREKKDYPTLLRAARRAHDEEPTLRFLAIGQGPLEAALQLERDRLCHDEGSFRFLGYRPDPARVLAAADAFTLTSRHEGLPVALLEALALGLPVVVSAVGGIPEVVTEGVEGRVLPAGDVQGFAAAYVGLARNHEQRAAFARAASARGAAFDIRRAAARLEAIYRHS